MLELVLEVITNILRFIFMFKGICLIKDGDRNKKYINLLICISYFICMLFLDKNTYRMDIMQYGCIFLIFLIWGNCKKIKSRLLIPYICFLSILFELVIFLTSIACSICVWFVMVIPWFEKNQMVVMLVVSLVLRVFTIYWLLAIISKYIFKIEKLIGGKYLIGVIYFLMVCCKIPFLYNDIYDGKYLKTMILTIICCTVIFLIISRIDKHNAEKERAKIEENNKKLSSKLHKSQEILPAMVQVLSNVTENGGTEMEEQEAHKLLEEVSDLYGQQLKENSKEDLQLKNFCSTGLKLLDEQLKVYQMEALDRNVNLDIFVQAPINGIMKKDNIDQLKLQRAVGDLIRNAFRVMEREDKKCRAKGHILLIIGCQYEGILEIAVVDNGAEFPLHVIQAFGRRGVTTGGTGNGLADLVEFADETKASIRVDEFAWETSSFTKKISIIFDKQRMNYFNSSRRELIESSFWNNN